ncbi:battenin [Brachionichthys hirsutus]|uniref:battenin n=1 Tax=Brachionichthys hirsutus TaxID=412623 RepID=UPI0036050563
MERPASVNADPVPRDGPERFTQWRNWIGFWLLGLCNNFPYVIMLSAAYDILKKQESGNATASVRGRRAQERQNNNSSNSSSLYDCNPVTTGAVLLADILPSLCIKLFFPFLILKVPYGIRVLLSSAATTASFLLVSFSSAVWMSILGVSFASFGSGLGEQSFLSLSVYFSRDVLGGWGSGTGGAGVAGALLYSVLTQAGLSPQTSLLFMLVFPLALLISYFVMLVPPPSFHQWTVASRVYEAVGSEEGRHLMDGAEDEEWEKTATEVRNAGPLTLTEMLHTLKGLMSFVVPLLLVYFAEYFINQGLMELLYFPGSFLSHAEQYRWYQLLYQIGVFVSRSSLCCVKIRKVFLFSMLQVVNAVLLLLAVRYQFLPNAWVVFPIIFYEGLLGGASYVNIFYFISKESEDRHREFSLAAASVGDSLGIALAALASFPVHRYFCSL